MLTRGFWRTTNEHHQTKLAHPIHCTLAARTSRDRTNIYAQADTVNQLLFIMTENILKAEVLASFHTGHSVAGHAEARDYQDTTVSYGLRGWATATLAEEGPPPPVAETFPRGSATVLTQCYRSVHTSHTCAQNKYTWCLMWNSL